MRRWMASFVEQTSQYYEGVQIAFIVAYIVLFFIKQPIWLYFYILFFIINAIMFLVSKDYLKNKKRAFVVCRVGVIVLSISFMAQLLNAFGMIIQQEIPIGIKLLMGLPVGLLTCWLLFNDNVKKNQTMESLRIKDLIDVQDRQKDQSQNDVQICIDKETGKPVYINHLDRFLHLFIVGPTGCGKTSQVLLPMITQDIRNNCGVTIIEPKGDLAEKVYALGVKYNYPVLYFNPIMPDCPYFNPLYGEESAVIETLVTTFEMLNPDSKTYFKDMNNNLIRKATMVIKRLEMAYTDPDTGISQRPATLLTLSDLIHNTEGRGRQYAQELGSIPTLNKSEEKQNIDTKDWFLNDYFADRSKTYENTSGIRTQVANLIQNPYLRRVLNPEDGISQINFEKILADGGKLAISTAQGDLGALGSYLGYFMILSFQSAVFKRPGNERTRKPHYIYIDECQKYANPGMDDMLAQGRSYALSANLATQTRSSMTGDGGPAGKKFLEVVSANARNVIVFPGISALDAKYYQEDFGIEIKEKERYTHSEQKFQLGYGLKPMNYPTESVAVSEEETNRYSATDIQYKPFSEITYKIIKDKSVQFAREGLASYIDKDLSDELDGIVDEYKTKQYAILKENDRIAWEQRQELIRAFLQVQNGGGSHNPYVTNNYQQQKPKKAYTDAFDDAEEENEMVFDGYVPVEEEPSVMFSDDDLGYDDSIVFDDMEIQNYLGY